VAKRCVLEQKLLLAAYRKYEIKKSIGTKMNHLGLCLELLVSIQGHVNSIALHSTLNISETVRDKGLVPKDHQ